MITKKTANKKAIDKKATEKKVVDKKAHIKHKAEDSDLVKYVKNYYKSLIKKTRAWAWIYVILNLLIFIVTVILSIMSSIQLYYNFKAFGEDSWQTYLLITTAITAGTTFFTSMISFFTMRKRILKYQARIQKIAIELFLHHKKLGVYHYKTRDLQLYKKVCAISNLDYGGIVYAEKKNKSKRSAISSKAS